MRRILGAAILVVAGACRPAPPAREYHLVGQILAVDRASSRVTVRHHDIDGLMPGMTMPFPVRDPRLLDGRVPGNLVDATLVVQGADAWIARLDVTGTAPLPPPAELPATGLAPGDRVADLTLTDQSGAPMHVSDLGGHAALVTFIYTRCPFPEYCPAIELRLAGVQAAIKADPHLAGTRILAVTLDPTHDTPVVLDAHARERGAEPAIWRFATGTDANIDRFGRQFGLAVTRTSEEPTGLEHNLRTVVLDPQLRIVTILTGSDWQVGEAVASLKAAADRL
jgi:protein SCO1